MEASASIESPPRYNGTTDVVMKEEPGTATATLPPSLPTQPSADEVKPPIASASFTPQHMARNSPAQSAGPPSEAKPHGAPARVYLNQNVTPHLLEAMKYLAVHEPDKPLKWLADFLAQRSTEVEGA